MRIKQLTRDVPVEMNLADGDLLIDSLAFDSKKAKEGSLFFCLRGSNVDGHSFAGDAVQKGARALVVEERLPIDIPQILASDSRAALSRISANFYDNPARKMSLIGVTGTNGKTSMTHMVKAIAEASCRKVGLIGTVCNMIGEEMIPGQMTTPDPIEFNELLFRMAERGVSWVTMEVSAHALYLRKLSGIPFQMGVFSNLSQDHLDYFKTMERYREAKMSFFTPEYCKKAVVNLDDATGRMILDRDRMPISGYGLEKGIDFAAENISVGAAGISYRMNLLGQCVDVRLKLTGLFNVYNSLGAAAACYLMGVSAQDIKAGLEGLAGVNGRVESVPVPGVDYTVIVDYAHTPDALSNVLDAIRGFCAGRILTVFGCGGDRDATKRPLMGEAAGRRSDVCVVTSDNPRTEDPEKIIDQIIPGLEKTGCAYTRRGDRREAIREALNMAKPGDVVLIAGKGHETYQIVGTVKHPFDDRQVVREYFKL